ncbi:MAG: hypothetical protein K8E24_014310 [Methanobacterium paludis]|nr:hypothetical protein [Methanobacterium paludis]
MGVYGVKLKIKDEISSKFKHKLEIFPKISYSYFMNPTLTLIEPHTRDYVPRNSNPAPAIDGYRDPGTLQDRGYYKAKRSEALMVSNSIFGYSAIDSYKGGEYAGNQYATEEYYHEPRYVGHKPRHHFLKYGIADASDDMLRELARRYKAFLERM